MSNADGLIPGDLKPISEYTIAGWKSPADRERLSRFECERLEAGKILFFEKAPFAFPEEDQKYLLGVRQTGSTLHKNIAYRPAADKITGLEKGSADAENLHRILRNFSQNVVAFATEFLNAYQQKWKLDYASFRPLQEKGRPLRTSARNDLLHVDNFPTRPTNGDRIARVFININPTESRRWITGDPIDILAPQYAEKKAIEKAVREAKSPLRGVKSAVKSLARPLGVVNRSPYDQFMIDFHHYLKHNETYQKECRKDYWEFPPGSVWIVYTDSVPHAVLSGQYMLEQTFLISKDAMVTPDRMPIRVLEKMAGAALG
ncbi:Kdo hydroxylase family protein [soil metagenome]